MRAGTSTSQSSTSEPPRFSSWSSAAVLVLERPHFLGRWQTGSERAWFRLTMCVGSCNPLALLRGRRAFDAGLYTPANVRIVYDEVLRRAQLSLSTGTTVILDGTWRDPQERERARELTGLPDKFADSGACVRRTARESRGEDPGQTYDDIRCNTADRRATGRAHQWFDLSAI